MNRVCVYISYKSTPYNDFCKTCCHISGQENVTISLRNSLIKKKIKTNSFEMQ